MSIKLTAPKSLSLDDADLYRHFHEDGMATRHVRAAQVQLMIGL